jgi:hypothetical protein
MRASRRLLAGTRRGPHAGACHGAGRRDRFRKPWCPGSSPGLAIARNVARLGRFVELEAVPATAGGLEAERLKVEELPRVLGIDDDRPLVARGYADQLGV